MSGSKIIFFNDYFFPVVITECHNGDINIGNSLYINVFKKELLKVIRPQLYLTLNIHDTEGLQLLTRFWLRLSHLGDVKLRRNFQDQVCPMCTCGLDSEVTNQFLQTTNHCPNHYNDRTRYDCLFSIFSSISFDAFVSKSEKKIIELVTKFFE